MTVHRGDLHSPLAGRGRRAGPRHKETLSATLKWVLVILVVTAVGWIPLSHYEARLHTLLKSRAGREDGHSSSGGREQDIAVHKAASLHSHQSSSAQCAAKLEASGLLPDSKGRWMWRPKGDHADRGAGTGSGGGDVGAGAAAALTVSAEALNFLVSRRRLYDAMEASLLNKGLALGAGITQGLGMGDMFRLDADGRLRPVLEALAVPVRAVVLPLLDQEASERLRSAATRHLAPLLPENGIWLQNSRLYHSTIYHASTHTDPVPASAADVDGEEAAIRGVGLRVCPLHVVLERVVATPSGTVVACWQVVDGTDVAELRRQLAAALPRASRQQIVQDHSILHTTLARIVAPPQLDPDPGAGGSDAAGSDGESAGNSQAQPKGTQGQRAQQAAGRRVQPGGTAGAAGNVNAAAAALHGDASAAAAAAREEAAREEAAVLLQAAVDGMTRELCGLEAVMDQLWFAEEHHKLALALNGRVDTRTVPLQCGGGQLRLSHEQHDQHGQAAAVAR